KGHSYFGKVGLVILTLLGLKYLPAWVKLVWLFHTAEKSIQALLRELIGLTQELTALQEKAVSLTIDYRER
ncbi:MAG: hypothetical protein E7D78_10420, partial [Prevotella bivia]|nr:hypothetical protein [Prevotella bivia]